MGNPSIQAFTFVQKNKKKVDFDVLEKNTEIRLWENTTFTEINSLLLKFFGYQSKFSSKIKIEDILKEVINSKFPEFAYLIITNSNSFELSSGCCFNFSDWKDMEKISPNFYDVWLGHSPMVAIKFDKKKNKYLIWNSEDSELNYALEVNKYIEFEKNEFGKSIKSLKQDLIDFGQILEIWSEQFDKVLANEAVNKIKKGIGIK